MSRDIFKHELRKHRRFCAREGAFVSTNGDHCLVGQILDISIGGMCFKYIANGETPSAKELNIFLSNRQFLLKNIRYKIISNIIMDPEIKLSTIPIGCCRVEFIDLNERQKSLLSDLING